MRVKTKTLLPYVVAIAAVAAPAAGCGGSQDTVPPASPSDGPLGHSGEQPVQAESEAAPESRAAGGGGNELPPADREDVIAAVHDYIADLNRRDGAAVCADFAGGSVKRAKLRGGGDCATSVRRSLGTKPANGGPAWRRTRVNRIETVSVGDGEARATATVTHRFSDRSYISVEEDVLYFDRRDDRWLLAQPSATFYRAVGYADPPLAALRPPG